MPGVRRSHPQADERLLWGERAAEPLSLSLLQHLGDLQTVGGGKRRRLTAAGI